jgi:hypothetical protein
MKRQAYAHFGLISSANFLMLMVPLWRFQGRVQQF